MNDMDSLDNSVPSDELVEDDIEIGQYGSERVGEFLLRELNSLFPDVEFKTYSIGVYRSEISVPKNTNNIAEIKAFVKGFNYAFLNRRCLW